MSLPWVLLLALAKTVAISLVFAMVMATILTWAERRQSAMVQNRIGPNRANLGPFRFAGLLHPLADGLKTIFKEDVTPDGANRFLHHLGPFLGLFPALVAFAVIPFGEVWCTGTTSVAGARDVCTGGALNLFQIADLHVGLLFVFAISSLGVYGAVLAGYATEYSSLKFAMFPLGEFVEVVLLGAVFATLFLGGWQVPWLHADGLYLPHAWLGPAMVAGLGGAGLLALAYSGRRRSGLLAVCALPLVLAAGLLGWAVGLGWGPELAGPPSAHVEIPYWVVQLLRVGAMVTKVAFMCWFQLMVRWTLPRFRYDQVMRLTWRYLLPLSLVNVLVTGVVILL